jgi:hypothetical protein
VALRVAGLEDDAKQAISAMIDALQRMQGNGTR